MYDCLIPLACRRSLNPYGKHYIYDKTKINIDLPKREALVEIDAFIADIKNVLIFVKYLAN